MVFILFSDNQSEHNPQISRRGLKGKGCVQLTQFKKIIQSTWRVILTWSFNIQWVNFNNFTFQYSFHFVK